MLLAANPLVEDFDLQADFVPLAVPEMTGVATAPSAVAVVDAEAEAEADGIGMSEEAADAVSVVTALP